MIFSSPAFLFAFLPAVAGAFPLALRWVGRSWALRLLLAGSLIFYGLWRIDHLAVLLASIVWNVAMGHAVRPGRRLALGLGIAGNLLLLGFFKYASFASGVLVHDLGLLDEACLVPSRALPLGISFFTFQQIAYLVDRARGAAEAPTWTRHALFVAFFPQLVAGPIVRHGALVPQLDTMRPNWEDAARGLMVFFIGCAKKVLIADTLAPLSDLPFQRGADLAAPEAWAGVLAYAMRLYFDFSGYSDMAVGLGLVFGVRLPWNFRSPYRSGSLREFWRRWHVTLGEFLRDCVYIPLGGARAGRVRTAWALLATFALGGLWHGAGWTFILWGLAHGAAVGAGRLTRADRLHLPRPLGVACTFLFVTLGWVLFRAENLPQAAAVYRALAGAWDGWPQPGAEMARGLPLLLGAILVTFLAPGTESIERRFRPTIAWTLFGAILALASSMVILGRTPTEFLYFEF